MVPMIRIRAVEKAIGKAGSTGVYGAIREGVLTTGVKVGPRAVAWPEPEIDLIMRHRIAGATEDEIRALVCELMAKRKLLGCQPAPAKAARAAKGASAK